MLWRTVEGAMRMYNGAIWQWEGVRRDRGGSMRKYLAETFKDWVGIKLGKEKREELPGGGKGMCEASRIGGACVLPSLCGRRMANVAQV